MCFDIFLIRQCGSDMSSQHVVAVWECQVGSQWWPLGAAASRQLERARHKRLTRVLLSDADPARAGEHVDLRHMTMSHGEREQQCPVRRSEFSTMSAAGKGTAWEWARNTHQQYDVLPMDVQCHLEESLTTGAEVEWGGWTLSSTRGIATGPGGTRVLRRVQSAPYPLARNPTAISTVPPPLPMRGRVQEDQTQSASEDRTPKDKRHGLARQILHNLNIFSISNKCESTSDSDRDSRRHSVDTVSTYLSQESKDTNAAVGDLLNCSVGSDEVFTEGGDVDDGHDGGITVAEWGCVRAVRVVQWGAVCPQCMQSLSGTRPVVSLPCHHMLHLACLPELPQSVLRCGVCGESHPAPPFAPRVPRTPSFAPRQPPGTMAWCVERGPLPSYSADTDTIRITYNFQSGVQRAGDPEPGARYFAVGFPRHTLLPDTPLGRRILSQLLSRWQRCELFGLSRSQTTGREVVVSWCLRVPPPSSASQYGVPHMHALLSLSRSLQADSFGTDAY